MNAEMYIDNSGRSVGIADGRYLLLQGNTGSVTGTAVITGQYQNRYDYAGTETGEQYVPVFVVDSLENVRPKDTDTGTDPEMGSELNMTPDAEADLNLAPDDTGAQTNTNAEAGAGAGSN
ncbi:hypothetical protein D3C80_1730070 [compost metagenome]